MTARQLEQARALARCTFTPGSAAKRFIKWLDALPDQYVLSTAAEAFLNRLAHSYRRQLGRCMADGCEVCK